MHTAVAAQHYPLAKSVNRVALLLNIHAGLITQEQLEEATVQDSVPRTRSKPIVAYGVRYESITAAARAMVMQRKTRWDKDDYCAALSNQKQRLTRLCNAGTYTGVYWSK